MLKRWYEWFIYKRHANSHGCPFCGYPFIKLNVSLYRHPTHILKSRLTSLNGEATCGSTRCGKSFSILRIGEGMR